MTAKDHGKRYRCIFRFKDAAPEIITITFDSTKHKTPQGQAWTLATAMFGDAVESVTVMPGNTRTAVRSDQRTGERGVSNA